jgi:hypothetical protein
MAKLANRYWMQRLISGLHLTVLLGAVFAVVSPAEAQFFRRPFENLSGAADEAEGEEPELETDRDSYTPATTVVGRGWTVIEASYSFVDLREKIDINSFPEAVARIGLNDWLELNLGGNIEQGGGAFFEKESNVLYGVKAALWEQRGWLPRAAWEVHATTPTYGLNTDTQVATGYIIGWTLPNRWKVDSAFRYYGASEESDHFNLWTPSAVLKVPLGERWNTHVEYFGIFSQNAPEATNQQFVSPGVHCLVWPNCELGVRVAWGCSEDAAHFLSNVGLGLRF